VVSLEKTNIRHLTADRLPEAPDIAVIDASFISLAKVLPATLALLRDGGSIIALIKPQFEVGPGAVGKGGVVRDAEKQREVVAAVSSAAEGMGLVVKGVTESPLLGAKGNREFLIILEKAAGIMPETE
jgi:23S rRNA (cytidine1920-2'-O)/16S rRNA (cytidine1409-2'-O)-methyltransferase